MFEQTQAIRLDIWDANGKQTNNLSQYVFMIYIYLSVITDIYFGMIILEVLAL